MLDRQLRSIPLNPPEPSRAQADIGLPQVLAFFRRRRMPIIVSVGVTLCLGVLYALTTPSQYMSVTSLLIDTRKLSIFGQGDVIGQAQVSNATVETQVQILQSSKIAQAVVTKLNLAHDSAFLFPNDGPIDTMVGKLRSMLGWQSATPPAPPPLPAVPEDVLNRAAVRLLGPGLNVGRVGLSYVIDVAYVDSDPQRAARIADAFTAAYVEDQFNSQVATAQRASDWLLSRINHLREQSSQQDLTAQEKSAIRSTYDTYLQRYTETVQQQSLPYTEARVVTEATPGRKVAPRTPFILIASLMLGGVIGLGVAIARDLLDKAVRTRRQVEAVTGVPFLGYLPSFHIGGGALRRSAKRAKGTASPVEQKFAAVPAYSVALNAPFSRFAETLRNVKVAAEHSNGATVRVLGVLSSVASEGRTVVAANLARQAAESGSRVLLVDGDLRNSALSKNLGAAGVPGLVQLSEQRAQIADLIWSDQSTKLDFLASGAEGKLTNATEILCSPEVQALLEACRRQYNLIVVDLPAVLPLVDARAASHLFDGFVFVVEWGKTSEELLTQAFHVAGIAEKVIGTVLNKTNLPSLKRFEQGTMDIGVGKYLESYRHSAA